MKTLFLLMLLPVLAFGQTAIRATDWDQSAIDGHGIAWTDTTTPALSVGDSTDWLLMQGYGFALGSDVVIDSVGVSITIATGNDPAKSGGLTLWDGNGAGATGLAKGRGETAGGTLTFSGDATYWGTSLNQSLINSGAFAIGLWVYADGEPQDALVELPTVTVYYHTPASRNRYAVTVLGSSLTNRPYTGSTVDTVAILGTSDYSKTYLNLASLDSASLTVKYQLSLDGSNWGVLTTADSLSTASNTGDVKSILLDTYQLGAPFMRLVISQNPSYRLGKTSATYSASVVQKH